MAVVLLVEDWPDLGIFEAEVLQAQGHTVLRCSGGPSPFAGCPLLRDGACRLADACDVIVVSGWPSMPLRHRTYRERDLIGAYRRHPAYGRKPMLVVSYEPVECSDGSGPIARIEKDASPAKVLGAVEALLSHARLSHHTPPAVANRRR